MTRRGRPAGSLGPFARKVLELAATQEVDFRIASATLQIARGRAQRTIHTLVARGYAVPVRKFRYHDSIRPVTLVRAASSEPAAPTQPDPLFRCLADMVRSTR